jgi:hypothetical protein
MKDDLQNQANQFKRGSTKLRKAMWWKNVKLNLMIAGVCLVIIVIIISTHAKRTWARHTHATRYTLTGRWRLSQSLR